MIKLNITHPDCPAIYQIRPTQGGGYEVVKNPEKQRISTRNGKEYINYGQPCGKYPWDIKQGIRIVLELMDSNPETKEHVFDVDLSKDCGEQISKIYKDWLEKIEIEVIEDEK